MLVLIAGLVLFLGVHSTRILAEPWRRERIAAMGEGKWKLVYSIVSVVGFVLIMYGYGQARQATVLLYSPPVLLRHLAAALTLFAFILIAAAYVKGTRIKARVGHPMILGVKVWAFAHLLANGTLADVVLFGSFVVWAIADYAAARRRDRAAAVAYPIGPPSRDLIAVGVGGLLWWLFGFVLHGPLIGVRPFA
ncbi:MAG TPA: NnrU family protein [Casimicrobiaceae bacterium]|nr:NnrU family protein [Casimicrobiaceae bacterium]